MDVRCDKCQTRYRVDDARIGPRGATLRCGKCENTFKVFRAASANGAPGTAPLQVTMPFLAPAAEPMPRAPPAAPVAAAPEGEPPPVPPAQRAPSAAAPAGGALEPRRQQRPEPAREPPRRAARAGIAGA